MKILSNLSFPGDEDFEILCFSGRFHDRHSYGNQGPIHFSDILERMPAGWTPDAVIFWNPGQMAIPEGIEDSPFLTIALLSDWFGCIDYIPDTLRMFDHIFTDRAGVSLLKRIGLQNVDYWPLFGFNPFLFRLLPDQERIYDVTFTGNLNANVQFERLPWLRRLCGLDRKYHVKLFYDSYNEEYVKNLNQSRIVFNRSIKGEMNQRTFEVPACGALLFLEEENLEVRDFLEPGKEVILYNRNNFYDLLYYYLEYEDERAAIADAGYRRIQNYSCPKLFGKLINMIEGKSLRAGQGRKGPSSYFQLAVHRDLVQTSLAAQGLGLRSLESISEIITKYNRNPFLLNDCAVFIATLKELTDQESAARLFSQALSIFTSAERLFPDFLAARFNRAQTLVELNRLEEACRIYEELINLEKAKSWESYKGIIYPCGFGFHYRFMWSMALSETVPDPLKMADARHCCIRLFAAERLGRISEYKGEKEDALGYFELANKIIPNRPFILRPLAAIQDTEAPDGSTARIIKDAISHVPFDCNLWKAYAKVLFANGSVDKGKKFIEGCILCLQRLQDSGRTKERIPQVVGDHESVKEMEEDFVQLYQFYEALG